MRDRRPFRGIQISESTGCYPINGMKFNKFQYQMLQLKQTNAEHKYFLGEEWLESSSNPAGLEHVCSDHSKDNLEFVLS